MFSQYFFQNIDFTLNALSFLVFLSLGFLHLDGWTIDKRSVANLLTKSIGFICIGVFYALKASGVDSTLIYGLSHFLLFFGLILVYMSLFYEKILPKPHIQAPAFITVSATFLLGMVSGILHMLIALQYRKKATKGLQKEVLTMYYGFFFLAVAQFLGMFLALSESSNVIVANIFKVYGSVWIVIGIFQIIGLLIISKWIFGYIRFRLNVQLFIITLTSSFLIFIVTTFVFTYVLLSNLQNDALGHLETDSRIFQFALESLQDESLSHTKAVAVDASIKESYADNNIEDLYDRAVQLMIDLETDFLVITDDSGRVVVRAEDQTQSGESLSSNLLIQSALAGNPLSTLVGIDDPLVGKIQVASATPLSIDDSVKGTVMTGFFIDDAFVDSVKGVTGLDTTIFSGDKKAATTLVGSDGVSRLVGTQESNQEVISTVLQSGETYRDAAIVLGEPYYAVYKPLTTLNEEIIGMIFIGKPQISVITTAEESFRTTFIGSLVLMVISILPAYYISRYIAENIEA